MKKKVLLVLLLAVSLFTLTGCIGEKEITDAERFKEEYESLNNVKRQKDGKKIRAITIPKDNPYQYITPAELINKLDNKDTFVVYFGFAECPWCRSVLPILTEVAADLDVTTIYYVDIQDIRDTIELNESNEITTAKKATKDYYELLKKLDAVLEDYTISDENGNEIDTNEKRIYAPNVISIVDGNAKELETGISDKQTDPYMELTEEIKADTYNKFKCVIKCVLENKDVCTSKKSC